MDVPKSFRPGKDLEENVKNLRFPKRKKVRSLKDLVLDRELENSEFVDCDELLALSDYPFLKCNVADSIFIDYSEPSIAAIEFKDKGILKCYFGAIVAFVEKSNKNLTYEVNALFKDSYLIFIYTAFGDYYTKTELIDIYKKEFDFEEVKVG